MAGKVCFQEAAKPTSTADIGRIAAIRNADDEGLRWVISAGCRECRVLGSEMADEGQLRVMAVN
jgi:hypothetical protein